MKQTALNAAGEMIINLDWDVLPDPFYNGGSDVLSYSLESYTIPYADDVVIDLTDSAIPWVNLIGGCLSTDADCLNVNDDLLDSIDTEFDDVIEANNRIYYRIRSKNVWGWGIYSELLEIETPRIANAPLLNRYPTDIIVWGASEERTGHI